MLFCNYISPQYRLQDAFMPCSPCNKKVKREDEDEWRVRVEREMGALRFELEEAKHQTETRETQRLRKELQKTKRALRRAAGWLREEHAKRDTLREILIVLQRDSLRCTCHESQSEHDD